MEPIDASTISVVIDAMRPERDALLVAAMVEGPRGMVEQFAIRVGRRA